MIGKMFISKYSEDDKLDLIYGNITPLIFSRRFKISPVYASRLKQYWRHSRGIITSRDRKPFKYNNLSPSIQYKVAPAEEQ